MFSDELLPVIRSGTLFPEESSANKNFAFHLQELESKNFGGKGFQQISELLPYPSKDNNPCYLKESSRVKVRHSSEVPGSIRSHRIAKAYANRIEGSFEGLQPLPEAKGNSYTASRRTSGGERSISLLHLLSSCERLIFSFSFLSCVG